MKNQNLEIITKKIQKFRWKLISKDEIKKESLTILQEDYTEKKLYKIIYYLKSRGYLVWMKKNLYYAKFPSDKINDEDIAERLYRKFLQKEAKSTIQWKRYIWGIKALEIASDLYDVPEEITIVNENRYSQENLILDKKIVYKTYTAQNQNLFKSFYKHTQEIKIEKCVFRVAKPELAILETLYNTSLIQKSYGEELIKKWLKKHKKSINYKIMEQLLNESKMNSSINKLEKLTSTFDQEISSHLQTIIKRFGYILY